MHRIPRFALTAMAAVAIILPLASAAEVPIARDGKYYMYVGTYTGRGPNGSQGIYVYRFDSATGKAESIGLAAETPSPSFLAIHPTQDYLYAANEAGRGTVSSFKIDRATGKLTAINTVPTSGNGPCWVAVDETGKMLVSAQFGDGSLTAYPIKEDGSIGQPTEAIKFSGKGPDRRQAGPHTHSANFSLDNHYLYVADFGIDRIMTYKVDPANAKLTPADPPYTSITPGSAPRHFSFHPNGKFAYVLSEIADKVFAFRYDPATGKLTEIQSILSKPENAAANATGSEILVHPSGMFLYSANRGDDSIAMFRINEMTGMLTSLGVVKSGGKTPRNFRISPDGKWLITENQDSNSMVFFSVDQNTGLLTPTGDTIELGSPVSIKFVPVTDEYQGNRGGGGGARRGRGARGGARGGQTPNP